MSCIVCGKTISGRRSNAKICLGRCRSIHETARAKQRSAIRGKSNYKIRSDKRRTDISMLNLKWLANGCEPKRLLLPPPLPSRVMVIANARQRGWTLQQIGISASVTFQAVEQFLFRYERFHGEVHPAPRHRFSYAPQISFECATCGARSWKTASDLTLKYCSRKCHGIDKRILTDDEILWAIDRRVQTGDTWTGLSNILKRDVQLIQRSIWIKLAEEGNLTKRIVSRIWQPSQSLFVKRGRWDWLIGLTGLEPRAE